jgi:hypothetical protein
MKDSSEKGESSEPPAWNWESALKSAILIGLSVEEFNYLTPYEFALYHEAYNEIKEAELKERLTLVWLGEYYHRTKRLPKLKDELKKVSGSGETTKVMSNEQMLDVVKRLNQQFGGKVIKGGE